MQLARIALLSAVSISTAFGQTPTFEKWLPTYRVLNELEAQLRKAPQDRKTLRALAEIQHLAFSVQVSQFHVYGGSNYIDVVLPDRIARDAKGKLQWEIVGKRWSSSLLVSYAVGGLIAYEKALSHYPDDSRLWLGYAGLLEDVWAYCFAKPSDQFPSELMKIRVPALREAYAVAFQLALRDEFLGRNFGSAEKSLAYSAALGALRAEKSGPPALSPVARQALEDYARMVEAKEPRRWLPIVCGGLPPFSPIRPPNSR